MKISPLHDKILIKEDKITETKVGGILLPTDSSVSKKPFCTGTVLALGAGRYQNGILIPLSVKVGDRVLYMKYSSNCYRDEDNNETLIRDEDLLGVCSDDL